MGAAELTFPLVPRRRLIGLSFGAMHSARRGAGSDVAGSRPYLPGDDIDSIDWNATARLSSARGNDEFIVRERYAEEAPRVVVVCDRRPAMSLYPPGFPWLSKPDAIRAAVDLIADSTVRARGLLGYLDCGEDEPVWSPPRSQATFREIRESRVQDDEFHGTEDNLTRAFEHLDGGPARVPAGSFVFVLSDFLVSPTEEVWTAAIARRWDVVPVVIQDPVWERSFPDVAGVVVPFCDPVTGQVSTVRLTGAEARERRLANEQRYAELLAELEALGLEAVVLATSEPEQVALAFLDWAEGRVYRWAHSA